MVWVRVGERAGECDILRYQLFQQKFLQQRLQSMVVLKHDWHSQVTP
jgi:hypothetical protein